MRTWDPASAQSHPIWLHSRFFKRLLTERNKKLDELKQTQSVLEKNAPKSSKEGITKVSVVSVSTLFVSALFFIILLIYASFFRHLSS